ncbi:restriction endonuclease subunit S [Rhodococcus pyridinivorans]
MSEWPLVPLSEVADWGSGGTPSRSNPEFYGGDIPWATIADLTDGPVLSTGESITRTALASSSAKLVPEGSVLVAMYGSIGKLGIPQVPMATNQAIAFATPRQGVLDKRFLFHFLRAQRRPLLAAGRGGTQANISQTILKSWRIPLPPLSEQCRIASILDHANNLRAKRREAIARLDELTQSIFIDMFGEAWDTWELSTVEEIAAPHKGSIRTGPFGSQLLHEEFTDSGIPVLGIDNAVSNEFEWGKRRYISEEKYRALERYTVHPGDVLITIMGTCGRCAIVPQDIPLAINTKHLCCITLDREKALPEFLHSYFLHDPEAQSYLRRTAKGAIMSGLNMGIIKKLPVPLVPLDLQRVFIQRVEHVKLLKSQQMRQLEDLDAAFVSIQSRAFLGEL